MKRASPQTPLPNFLTAFKKRLMMDVWGETKRGLGEMPTGLTNICLMGYMEAYL